MLSLFCRCLNVTKFSGSGFVNTNPDEVIHGLYFLAASVSGVLYVVLLGVHNIDRSQVLIELDSGFGINQQIARGAVIRLYRSQHSSTETSITSPATGVASRPKPTTSRIVSLVMVSASTSVKASLPNRSSGWL